MATTPNQTKRTVCDYIHSNLQSKLSENQAKTSVKSLSSTRQDNLSAIQAVTAVERAKTNDDYKKNLPPETLTTYARALETFAVKRGIKPEGEDGKFSDDQKTKEFTTENLIYFFSKDLIETASSDEERKSFKDDIDTSIKDIYEDSPIPEPITKSVYNYLSNEMILSMSDEDIKEAISRDPTLANRIDEIKSNNQKELEDSAGRADTMRDPDWGHDKGDDDFKIQDGDIIQYLMKEVILSSAAWATNRVAGTAGTFVYELGSGFHRNVTSPLYKNACDAFGNWWDNLGKDSSLSKEEIEKRGNLFAEAFSQCEDNKKALNGLIESRSKPDDENNEKLKKLTRRLIKHFIVLDDDGVLFPCKEGEDVNSPERKKSYDDYQIKVSEEQAKCIAESIGKKLEDFKTETVDGKTQYIIDGKSNLQTIQNRYDLEQLEEMKKILSKEDPKKVEEWFHLYNRTKENGIRINKDTDIIKMQKQNPSYYKALSEARESVLTRQYYENELYLYKEQAERFSESYVQFLLTEEYRKNPETDILSDHKKTEEFMERSKLEATAIFHNKHKERRDPKKKDTVPSIDAMIEEMDGLVEKAYGYLEKRSKEKIENPYEKQRPKSKKKCEKIIEAAQENAYTEDIIQGLINSREKRANELKDLSSRNEEVNKKRNAVIESKNRLTQKTEAFKREKPTTSRQIPDGREK